MDDAYSIWLIFIVTFVPLAGLAVVFSLAWLVRGPWRWGVLIAGPLVLTLAAWFAARPVTEGEPLVRYVFTMLFLFLWFYYPALVLVAFLLRRRRRFE